MQHPRRASIRCPASVRPSCPALLPNKLIELLVVRPTLALSANDPAPWMNADLAIADFVAVLEVIVIEAETRHAIGELHEPSIGEPCRNKRKLDIAVVESDSRCSDSDLLR